MSDESVKTLAKHLLKDVYGPKRTNLCRRRASVFLDKLIEVIFPERGTTHFNDIQRLEAALTDLFADLRQILACVHKEHESAANDFFAELPELEKKLREDAAFTAAEDPAARSLEEVILCYPGFYATVVYRFAHCLDSLGVKLLPRLFTEIAHSSTGIDIHPTAKIDVPFLMDHGTGIVVGETAVIGKKVKLYQGVTLGAMSVDKSKANTKRHPTIEDGCVIYANATILGGNTVIGAGATIGGSVWITESVAAGSRVFHKPSTQVT